jgi:hypothetical protein
MSIYDRIRAEKILTTKSSRQNPHAKIRAEIIRRRLDPRRKNPQNGKIRSEKILKDKNRGD